MTQRLVYLTAYGDRLKVRGDVIAYTHTAAGRFVWVDPDDGYGPLALAVERVEIEVSA